METVTDMKPWYAGGLAFECTGCGGCCAGPGEGYVWVTPKEIVAIAKLLGLTEDKVRRKYVRKVGQRFSLVERKGNKDCIFLQPDGKGGRNCRIYDARPVQCRTWPFWPSNIADADSWCLAGRRCPGINRGRLYNADEIQHQSQQIAP
ncbi:MAG: YkgJ family cysteine cluster protein [Phycisphaerae bacterium]|nr:YkgJ family cysteine cluster protein [Phycisphaerae bacterium]